MISSSIVAFSMACSNVPERDACTKALEASYYQFNMQVFVARISEKLEQQVNTYYPGGMKGATTTAIVVESVINDRLNYPVVLNGEKNIRLITTAHWGESKQYMLTLSMDF